VRRLFAIAVAPSTWRRWAYLILGGAMCVPFGTFGGLVFDAVTPAVSDPLAIALGALVAGVALPLAIGHLAAVRELELVAARALLDVRTGEWVPERRRGAWSFYVHLLAGGVISGATLYSLTEFPLALVAIMYAAAGIGALLARLAPTLLGPSAAEQLAILAERNRVARELHDSVGHALGVVSIQAAAAERVLDADPEFAREALRHIAASAREGQRDLDHALGLLRDDSPPARSLRDLPQLLETADVAADVSGDLERVTGTVSREAYRIIQEGLTNAARHAGGPARLRVNVREDRLRLELSNPVGSARPGGGRGLKGIEERVAALRGRMSAGRDGGDFRLTVELPL
jgi:signal transduction histidine kinase